MLSSLKKKDMLDYLDYYSRIENWQQFIEEFFLIKDRLSGAMIPFVFDDIQNDIFAQCLAQWNEYKCIDLVILKGRRAGVSSIVNALHCCLAFFFPQSVIKVGADSKENANIHITMSAQFLDNDILRDILSIAYNVKRSEAIMIGLESIRLCNGSYFSTSSLIGASVSDRKSVGAGSGIRGFHGTELFVPYSSLEKTFDAIDKKGYGFLESTPRPNTAIHTAYQKSLSEYSKRITLFYPWWKDKTNVDKYKLDQQPSNEALEYAKTYNPDLTLEQLAFLDSKIASSSLVSFNEEYPATPELAFTQEMTGFYFEYDLIHNATRMSQKYYQQPHDLHLYPVVIGVDPAYTGKDKCVVVVRQGQFVHDIIAFRGIDSAKIFSEIYMIYQKFTNKGLKIRSIFIDKTGSDGLVTILKENLGSTIVRGVSFGETPMDSTRFLNKGAEMMYKVKEALLNGLTFPENKNLIYQLSNMKFEHNIKSQLKREPKDKLKERIGMSPDEFDALALTFAFNVPIQVPNNIVDNYYNQQSNDLGSVEIFRKSFEL